RPLIGEPSVLISGTTFRILFRRFTHQKFVNFQGSVPFQTLSSTPPSPTTRIFFINSPPPLQLNNSATLFNSLFHLPKLFVILFPDYRQHIYSLKMSKIKYYIASFRLRTLPLSLS